jgi:hypothetical protein
MRGISFATIMWTSSSLISLINIQETCPTLMQKHIRFLISTPRDNFWQVYIMGSKLHLEYFYFYSHHISATLSQKSRHIIIYLAHCEKIRETNGSKQIDVVLPEPWSTLEHKKNGPVRFSCRTILEESG